MKNIITTILLVLITISINAQDKDVTKFRTDRYGVANKINGDWESFTEWNMIEDPALIVIRGKEKIIFYHKETYNSFDIYDYSTGEEEGVTYVEFITIDGDGKQCRVILALEEDEEGNTWTNMYFYWNTVKLVYSLY